MDLGESPRAIAERDCNNARDEPPYWKLCGWSCLTRAPRPPTLRRTLLSAWKSAQSTWGADALVRPAR